MQNNEETNELTLAQAARLAPGKPSPSCIWRWCRNGVKARTGERVRLEHSRFGGRVFTSREALERFGRKLAEADAAYFDARPDAERRVLATPENRCRASRRERQIAAAERECHEAGI